VTGLDIWEAAQAASTILILVMVVTAFFQGGVK
jgi:hypothetical protein